MQHEVFLSKAPLPASQRTKGTILDYHQSPDLLQLKRQGQNISCRYFILTHGINIELRQRSDHLEQSMRNLDREVRDSFHEKQMDLSDSESRRHVQHVERELCMPGLKTEVN